MASGYDAQVGTRSCHAVAAEGQVAMSEYAEGVMIGALCGWLFFVIVGLARGWFK